MGWIKTVSGELINPALVSHIYLRYGQSGDGEVSCEIVALVHGNKVSLADDLAEAEAKNRIDRFNSGIGNDFGLSIEEGNRNGNRKVEAAG